MEGPLFDKIMGIHDGNGEGSKISGVSTMTLVWYGSSLSIFQVLLHFFEFLVVYD